jgi:molybdopterin-guanine dinucleotide biosynthesis protein A
MLQRIVEELRGVFEDIVVVDSPGATEVLGAHLITDEVAYQGPASALERGMRAAANEIAFACSCDLPLIRSDVASFICESIVEADAAIPQIDDKLQPLCAGYRREAALDALARMSSAGEKRMREIASYLNARIVSREQLRKIDRDMTSFLNVNTPQDYQTALRLIR